MKKLLLISFVLLFVFPERSFAWGKTGHHIVAQIAKAHLEPGVLDSVQKYLGDMSFEDAATWMDDVRKDKTYDYMKTWHYINVEKDKTYVFTTADDHDALDNVVKQVENAINQLMNHKKSGAEEINMQLKLLFHLIGDMHQPLHVGYGEDKGGNDVKVDYLGKKKNLHSVWDSEIIESKNITYDTVEAKCKKLSKGKLKKIRGIDVMQWMKESRSYLPQVYKFENKTLDQKYIDKNTVIIEDQLLRGGLRLAAVLNTAFGKQSPIK
ncbi:MAG: nuclease [Bacteroidetes bacterium]|jgi:hypothetical protein|nr:nuclease [Bacteroidota bacterium]